ncbi:MAG: hypothetical protein LBC61_05030 [Candidatus Peribacteria bacterium]|nr:hypothetical protein [Candidatus Peribacteria bacterium]
MNISCPNQYNVSGIQTQEEKLRKLIQEVIDFRRILSTDDKRHLILVKVASNLNKTTIDMITKVCNEVECNSIEDDTERKFSKVDIITATNTSTEHNYRRKD